MSVLVEGFGGPQVKRFEQVTSDCHQMSLAGLGPGLGWGCPMSGGAWAEGVPCLMSEGVIAG